MAKKLTPESAVLKQITDWLTANRIWHERRNTGAMVSSYKGTKRMMRFSAPGTADIMAVWHPESIIESGPQRQYVVWIECKAPGGKMSEAQMAFRLQVQDAGHFYILAYSVDDVMEVIYR